MNIDTELKLFLKFPWYYYFLVLLVFVPFFDFMSVNSLTTFDVAKDIFLFLIGIFVTIVIISANIFKKTGFIITDKGITIFNIFYKKLILWEEIISYSITENIKGNNLFLNFQTKESIMHKGIIKSKNVISISAKFFNIDMDELIEYINKIRK
jgi:hypothetical protein